MNAKLVYILLAVLLTVVIIFGATIRDMRRTGSNGTVPSSPQLPTSDEVGELYPDRGWPIHVLYDKKNRVTCYTDTVHGGVSCVKDVEVVPCRQEPKSN